MAQRRADSSYVERSPNLQSHSKSVAGNNNGLLLTSLKILGLLSTVVVIIVVIIQLSAVARELKAVREEVSSLKKEPSKRDYFLAQTIDTREKRDKALRNGSCESEVLNEVLRSDVGLMAPLCSEGFSGCCLEERNISLPTLIGEGTRFTDLPNEITIRVCKGYCGPRVVGGVSIADQFRKRPCVPKGTVTIDFTQNSHNDSKTARLPLSHHDCLCGN